MSTNYFKFYVNFYIFGKLVQFQPKTEYSSPTIPWKPTFVLSMETSKTKRAFTVIVALFVK